MNESQQLHLSNLSLLAEHLIAHKQTITCAESCTGGGLAYSFTTLSGSSSWFKQSWVTYSNEAKIDLIGVQPHTLDKFGAVAEQTVLEMAQGALRCASSDYAVAISGIAGPDGGTVEKPVGLVWFGIAVGEKCKAYQQVFKGDRQAVRQQAIHFAVEKLISSLVVSVT